MRKIFTEAQLKESRAKRKQEKHDKLKNVNQIDVEEQLGFAYGDIIVFTKLPSLSVDGFCTNKYIQVTEQEEDKYESLNKKWYNVYSSDKESVESNKAWSDLRKFHSKLIKKYLPKTLECYFGNIYVKDWEAFKDGLRSSLWSCDSSHYDVSSNKSIKIDISDNYCTKITLKLKI